MGVRSLLFGLALGQVPLPGTSSVTIPLAAPSSCHDCHGAFDATHDAYDTWLGSAMGNSARNPLFLAALTDAEHDSPGIGDFCLRCHAPDGWLQGRCTPTDGSRLSADDSGTTCALCHRMQPSTWKRNGQFLVGEDRIYRGEYADSMASHEVQYSSWLKDPAFCAPCHDLRNPRVAWKGHEPMRFPEQSTYTEWSQSDYANAQAPADRKTCQDCHLPESPGKADERGPMRASRASHDLSGGNVFSLSAIAFLEPGLGITDALTAGQTRAQAMLQKAAGLDLSFGTVAAARGRPLSLSFKVTNNAGHKLPTGYPEGRRVWLEAHSDVLGFHRGAFDPASGEPIDPLAVYETRQTPSSTTGLGHVALLDTIAYDSRIPPKGMAVTATVAPVGKAFQEIAPGVLANFDVVTFTATVPCDAPADIRVHAALFYQSTSKAHAGALVRRVGTDPRGLRLQLAMENADMGPFLMASLDAVLPVDPASSCPTPDAGERLDVGSGFDAGAPVDAAAAATDAQGGRDASNAMAPSKGCGCDAHGRSRGADGGAGLILLILAARMLSRRRRRIGSVALVLVAAGCGKGSGPPIPPLSIETATLPEVKLGDAYDQMITASGGKAPYVFSLSGGALPDGIDLKSSGQLTGLAGQPGHARFTVKVADAAMKTATQDLTLYVIPEPLTIQTLNLPGGKQGTAYDQTLNAKGGIPPLTWSLGGGQLPMGLEVKPEGKVSGTPAEFGAFDFKVEVKDAESTARDQPLHITVRSLNPMIETSSVVKGRVGEPYMATLLAKGGDAPYTWSIASAQPHAPMGLNLSTDGTLAGTPTEANTFMLAIQVVDGSNHMDTKDLSLKIIAPLTITTSALPQLIQGRPYDVQLQASGGEPPYAWSLGQAANTLPPGVTFDGTGRLRGSSMQLGDYPLAVRVEDSDGFQKSALFVIKVTDRYTYTMTSTAPVPATCRTGTVVSYQTVSLDVADSYQIEDLQVTVKVTYPAVNDPLRVILWSPDGIEAVLCGNGANDGTTTNSGGHMCNMPFIQQSSGGINQSFSDVGAATEIPDTPLATFKGTNPRGTWKLSVGVVAPSCSTMGRIDGFSLSIKDDRSTTPYVFVRGYTKNNLVIEPMVRICSPLPPPNATCGAIDEHKLLLVATAYSVGPNGIAEGGKGDDVALPAPMTWAWSGAPIPDVELLPNGQITAGRFTGMSAINVSGNGVSKSLVLRVVAPKWNRIFRGF